MMIVVHFTRQKNKRYIAFIFDACLFTSPVESPQMPKGKKRATFDRFMCNVQLRDLLFFSSSLSLFLPFCLCGVTIDVDGAGHHHRHPLDDRVCRSATTLSTLRTTMIFRSRAASYSTCRMQMFLFLLCISVSLCLSLPFCHRSCVSPFNTYKLTVASQKFKCTIGHHHEHLHRQANHFVVSSHSFAFKINPHLTASDTRQ